MTEEVFRTRHSEIVEWYQYIEMHLKGICVALTMDEDKSWFNSLDDFDSDPLGKLILKIKTLQEEKKINLFSASDFDSLDTLRLSRNYWIHQCFSADHHVIFKRGMVRDVEFAKRINEDLRDAMDWDEKIVEKARDVIPKPPSI